MQNEHTETIVELTGEYAVFEIPEHTVALDMNLKVFDGEKIVEYTKSYTMDEVIDAVKDAKDNYFDPDETYVLTEEGRKFVEEYGSLGLANQA